MLFIPGERLLLYLWAKVHWSIEQVYVGGNAAVQTCPLAEPDGLTDQRRAGFLCCVGYESNVLDQIGNVGHEGERSSETTQLFTQFLWVFYTVFSICLSQDSGPRYMNKCVDP
jgi:hypothetical protein